MCACACLYLHVGRVGCVGLQVFVSASSCKCMHLWTAVHLACQSLSGFNAVSRPCCHVRSFSLSLPLSLSVSACDVIPPPVCCDTPSRSVRILDRVVQISSAFVVSNWYWSSSLSLSSPLPCQTIGTALPPSPSPRLYTVKQMISQSCINAFGILNCTMLAAASSHNIYNVSNGLPPLAGKSRERPKCVCVCVRVLACMHACMRL